tara:strand:- start:181 stop:609 length:429 start_codon:yes stop_codon:yes gene_type:complete
MAKIMLRDDEVADLLEGQKVEIYRNLHKKCYSIRQKGKVIAYLGFTNELILRDVKFAVQPAGRDRVRRERKKNVHAFVRGIVMKTGGLEREGILRRCGRMVRYDPYTMDSFEATQDAPFVGWDGDPVYEGKNAIFRNGKVLV